MLRTTALEAESPDPKRPQLAVEMDVVELADRSKPPPTPVPEPESIGVASSVAPLPSLPSAPDSTTADPNDSTAGTTEEVRIEELPPPDGGFEAWLTVGCGATLSFWFIGVTYSWGVIQSALVEQHLAPASTLAFIGSLAVASLSLFGIINARLLRSIGARPMALAGTAFLSLSQILASFTTHNVGGLFVTAGVMMGIGVSLAFMVVSVVPAQYFARKRGTAIGLIYAGGGIGGAVLSLAMEAGVRNLGVEWTFRLLGLLMAACCTPAAWFMKERQSTQRKVLIDWSLLKSWEFVLLFAAGAIATFPLFVPPFFLPLYAQSAGMSASAGALLVALFNFSSAFSRIGTGVLSDRLTGPLNALFLSLCLTALTLLALWPQSTNLGSLVAFVLLNGAGNGAFFSIMPTVTGHVLGNYRMGTAFGMIVTGWAGGYLMGAPIAGYLLAAYGGQDAGMKAFKPAIFWAGGMAAGAAGIVAALRLMKSTDLRRKM